jgi:hypothetical protein
LGFLFFNSPFARAECLQPSDRTLSLTELESRAHEIQRAHFPELDRATLRVTDFKSEDSFLQAQPAGRSLFGDPLTRTYEIQVNPQLLTCPPSQEALTAILHHEFEHLLDYTGWSGLGILGHGARYLMSENFRIRYERQTDLKALENGHALGLIAYRNWLYDRLTPAQVAEKRRTYFTPEEIREWLESDRP